MGIFFLFNLIALYISTIPTILSINKKRFIIEVSQSELNKLNNTFNNKTTNEKNVDDGHVFFNIIVGSLLLCILAYIIIFLYKKYRISNTRLDYELKLLREKDGTAYTYNQELTNLPNY